MVGSPGSVRRLGEQELVDEPLPVRLREVVAEVGGGLAAVLEHGAGEAP